MADSSPPKTPEKVGRIPKDDSFKTCKTTMATPRTRRQLRMTPARASILSGGKPFHELSSSKKFNSRRRGRRQNDTAGSNDTFTRYETELLFDRDSLELSDRRLSKSPQKPSPAQQKEPKPISPQQEILKTPESQKEEPKPIEPEVSKAGPLNNQSLSKQPTFLKKKEPKPIKNPSPKKNKSPKKARSPKKVPSPKKVLSPKKVQSQRKNQPLKKTLMPPPPVPKLKSSFITPQAYKKPSSLASTASRYLSTWNSSCISERTRHYKSTAELERDYFSSLRSF